MVAMLSPADHTAIDAAIAEAEKTTRAKIRVSIIPASDRYQDFILLYGLILGTLISLILWMAGVVDRYPWLLCMQFGALLILDMTSALRHLAVRLIPLSVRHRRAARQAFHAYHQHAAALPTDQPLAFLFVSTAERYVHVVTNPALHRRVPDNWQIVIDGFVQNYRKQGLANASITALGQIGNIIQNCGE